MKIYLVGDRGSKTAFKILTARVYDSLDKIIEEAIEDYKDYTRMEFEVYIEYYIRVFIGDTESKDRVKKMTKKCGKKN